jgi:hypothetical protein
MDRSALPSAACAMLQNVSEYEVREHAPFMQKVDFFVYV